ncbi:MAG: DUF2839 family protein [Waterburya sp.]
MGEAKRRKQKLGAEYGQPLGITASARNYFRGLVESKQIQLAQHYILLKDVLTVLATEF